MRAIFSGTGSAVPLLDTITSPFDPNGGAVIGTVPQITPRFQSNGVSFSTTNVQTITSILAYIASPTGQTSVNLGIMASIAGLPSGTFLDIATAPITQGQPVALNNLNWSLDANTQYWLVATKADGGFDVWNRGTIIGSNAISGSIDGTGPWSLATGEGLFEACIDAVAATPLPSYV